MSGTGSITIRNRQWVVSLTSTYAELTTGLSGVESIPAGTGMLFDLGTDYSVIQIDMTQMLFPLDIIFINSAQGVVGVMHNVQPGETDVRFEAISTPGARWFLEVNAGEAEGISVGDDVAIQGSVATTQPNIASILNFVIIFMIVVFMGKMAIRAVSPPKPRLQLYGPRGERLLQTEQKINPKEWQFAEGMWEVTKEDAERGDVAGEDIMFCEYIRDLVKLGEKVTDEEAKVLRDAWKKRWGQPYLAQTVPRRELRFADRPQIVTADTLRGWLKEGLARPIQTAGFYGAEGYKPRLYVVGETIYQIEWGPAKKHQLLPAGIEHMAHETKERLRKEGVEIGPPAGPPPGKPTRADVTVSARQKLGVWITDKRTGVTLAEWTDRDARTLFEEGSFRGRVPVSAWEAPDDELVNSVLDYAEAVGLLAKKSPVMHLPQTEKGQYAWLITDPETGEIIIKPGYTTVSKAQRAARDFALRRAKYAGEHTVKLRIYDREPDIGDLETGVVFRGEIRLPEGRVMEEMLEPQALPRFKPGEIVKYKGERVRVSEQIGDMVNIFIPSRQELVWVKPETLERIEGELLAKEVGKPITKGGGGKPASRKVYFIGSCKVEQIGFFPEVEWFCITHNEEVGLEVRCPRSPLTNDEWKAAFELVREAFPEGQQMAKVIPIEPRRPRPGKEELEFLPDSPEVLAQTIDAIGYREKIDTAFLEAIKRAKGLR